MLKDVRRLVSPLIESVRHRGRIDLHVTRFRLLNGSQARAVVDSTTMHILSSRETSSIGIIAAMSTYTLSLFQRVFLLYFAWTKGKRKHLMH